MSRRMLLAAASGIAAVAALPLAAAVGANGHANARAVCPSPPAGYAHCHELVVTDARGNPLASGGPTGLSPATIKSVYGFPTDTTAGAGKTIAIVDAYDDPTAESDLAVFSSQFGLPACTTANGCFRKVNQTGGTRYPRTDSGWALEISLDVQWAHAIAPGAAILLVEASSNSFTNLMAAEDYARTHAEYVSNSWGGSEWSGEGSYDSHFMQSGVSFFVSAGDSGLPAEYPSASPNVISVGGTTLTLNPDLSLQSETGWSSGGGGCSAYESATSAQSPFSGSLCPGGMRATPDVSLDADPSSGVSVYDSTPFNGQSGWFTVGGTSASSPMWAAQAAVQGAVVNSAYVYGSSITYRDITSGNNGAPCQAGFDLCTGRGSWVGGGTSTTQPALSFATASQTFTADTPSGAMQVAISAAPSSSLTVTVSSSSGTGSFSTSSSGPWSSTATLTIAGGATTSGDFYYEDTTAGTPALTASAPGTTSATQTETVNPATLSAMTVTLGAGPAVKKGPNYRVPLTVTVTGTSGPLSGAAATLNVYKGSTCAGTVVASGSATTGSNGQAGFTFSTRQTSTWCALVNVSAAGYTPQAAQTTFTTQ